MNSSDEDLGRFVRALHRRQVAVRAAEHGALGLAVGCAAAVLLVPVLLWRGQDGWEAAVLAMALGLIAGVVAGLARRPSALAAAAEADRQLGTDDLLGTAWWVAARRNRDRAGDPAGDDWDATVLNLAAARVRGLSPSSVVLHRFGPRAWGVVTLAVALVVTLTSFSPEPLPTSPAVARGAAAGPGPRREVVRPLIELTAESSDRARRREQNPGDTGERGDASMEIAGVPETQETDDAAPQDRADASHQPTSSGGVGEGAGQTAARGASADDRGPSARPVIDRTPAPSGTRAAGGVGAARSPSTGEDTGAGGTVIGQGATLPQAPWEHPSWAAAAEAATEAVRAGRVPDDARDLVRSYFDRTASQPTSPNPAE